MVVHCIVVAIETDMDLFVLTPITSNMPHWVLGVKKDLTKRKYVLKTCWCRGVHQKKIVHEPKKSYCTERPKNPTGQNAGLSTMNPAFLVSYYLTNFSGNQLEATSPLHGVEQLHWSLGYSLERAPMVFMALRAMTAHIWLRYAL